MADIIQNLPQREFNTKSESRIGFMMIKMGKLSVVDAARVIGHAKKKNLRFGDVAKQMGLVTENDIQDVLSKQFSYVTVFDKDEFSKDLVAVYQPNSAQAEYLRSVRTQLSINWFNDDNQALAISGIERDCGASRFSANLAVTFSQFGKRTLLIDANLRHPALHSIFNVEETPGLSDLLMGRAGLEAISKIYPFENLSLLAAGTLPPNPQELVSGNIFKEVILFLHQMFDVILIETPPFSAGSDAQAISVAVGGTLLLSRKHQTKAAQLEKTAKLLKKSQVEVVGSVLIDY